ncbi:response regulator transcription factor [Alkalihalobacillus pseudalcaliphilus]|uniref:response regulator transcription factor n=1 Tax=Alkalihalobacillus pseudalcaliphilus TaxID=79884 RepID=UPI00064E0390|nr:response regulator transcription factor [Alkalihalobacillus pseudalcaliphilus]KMK74678.1 hypothetical protein AB990_19490 [Alkalihalobacillus pseudalcaliphilus]
MSHHVIALLESEPAHATLIEYHLHKMGIHVHAFDGGHSFLHTVSSLESDVYMISDQLDDIPITDVLTEIDKIDERKVIVIMTTEHQPAYHSDVHQLIFIHKPFTIQEFRDCLEPIFESGLLLSSAH